eukprot:TRINITY_DN10202_c0_g1_i1.p1 TRINITY_DN10202_c0_g1~~TRINITY_DN10202_c0_g1_i1.p1  ORF type:complete len:107 (+),score=19.49 TRINITY_DN10202_c0_g1_i1:229-549(+)
MKMIVGDKSSDVRKHKAAEVSKSTEKLPVANVYVLKTSKQWSKIPSQFRENNNKEQNPHSVTASGYKFGREVEPFQPALKEMKPVSITQEGQSTSNEMELKQIDFS